MSETPKAHTRKPDPSEPWRYVCPSGHQVNGRPQHGNFWCNICRKSFHRDELVGKKSDRYEEVMGPYA